MHNVTITLPKGDAFDLIFTLQDYIEMKSADIKQVTQAMQTVQDEPANEETCSYDDYTDIIADLKDRKRNAQDYIKLIQRQTGLELLSEEDIDAL